ncbi:MAG: hypothetical protein JWM93_977 [Frankiales bacterium]|nr:hypothetical protein [Frankiales bacterium]
MAVGCDASTVDLTDADARLSVVLRPIAYQFGADGTHDDNNWLVIDGAVTQRRNKWTFAEPCLQTTEALRLGSWLRGIAAQSEAVPADAVPSLYFTEPNLAFSLLRYVEGAAVVRVHLSLESAPPWEQDSQLLSFFLEMTITGDDLRAAADEWERELLPFPERP